MVAGSAAWPTAEIAKFAEGNTSARARAALGVALIVAGELDEAITMLEAVAKDAPDDAAVQTNLSAAYLARARWFSRRRRLAEGARLPPIAPWRSTPNAPEPYFNRALAYEGLDQTARAAARLGRLHLARTRFRLDARSRGTQESAQSRIASGNQASSGRTIAAHQPQQVVFQQPEQREPRAIGGRARERDQVRGARPVSRRRESSRRARRAAADASRCRRASICGVRPDASIAAVATSRSSGAIVRVA